MQPRAYYNELDPYCAAWLQELQSKNLIAPGDIDTRDIRDVKPSELRGYTQHHFFAGIGGWSLGLRLAGVGDHEEVWTGSCPCQPFSAAGKRGGFADERHLWPSFYHLISQCRPSTIFGEQVASAAEWLRLVRGDLETLDYAVGCLPVEAASAGADHLRDRYWFVAEHVVHDQSDGRSEGRTQPELRSGRNTTAESSSGRLADARGRRCTGSSEWQDQFERRAETVGAGNGVGQADAHGARLSKRAGFGRVQRETLGASKRQAAERDGLADANSVGPGTERLQRGGKFLWLGGDSKTRPLGDSQNQGCEWERVSAKQRRPSDSDFSGTVGGSEFSWVLGADGKARRVESDLRLLVDEVPDFLAGLRTGEEGSAALQTAQEAVIYYGQATNTHQTDVLRAVWKRILSEPEAVRDMGESQGVRGAEILLPFLRELGKRFAQKTNSVFPSTQEFEEAMRSLRFNGASARPSLRWGYSELCAEQHSDALHTLSRILAQYARTTWEVHKRANAKAVRLLETDIPARVAKLRAFGNAIVPRCAAQFIKAYYEGLTPNA